MLDLNELIDALSDERKAKLIALLSTKKSDVKKSPAKEISITDTYVCTLCGDVSFLTYNALSNSKFNRPRTYHITHCDKCYEYLMQFSKGEIVTMLIQHFTRRQS